MTAAVRTRYGTVDGGVIRTQRGRHSRDEVHPA
ncbi:hypothetical protein M878_00940 [Streptomyces roseochromogenus subsp. oscitans DS 12.976]|uniref:Uncharacterized protein n=1 Tax=Streptomyces roseochromogenus subsp. oscitans DS 12.976 TaxID=1352936 RepID=V6KXG5_STRRC|nr:hypothetical protein M878_00940 [Streptomyces roseochromogenus subsp. oscitans DS 12.976]